MAIDPGKSTRGVAGTGDIGKRGSDSAGKHWVETLAVVMERIVPDAITTSILLLVVLFLLSLFIDTPLSTTLDAYYRGLWNLLAFTMQMTLILVLSLILGATPFFKTVIVALSRLPKTTTQVVTGAAICGALVAYFNWGLSIALSPVIAIHFAKEAERKRLPVDFLFLLSTLAGVGAIWQFGLSGSAPLLMATPGHFLEKTTGIMPLSTTIWSPAAIVLVVTFTTACIICGVVFMPKKIRPISEFTEASASVGDGPAADDRDIRSTGGRTFAQRLEQSWLVMAPLALGLGLLAVPALLRQGPQHGHQRDEHAGAAARRHPSSQRLQLHQSIARRRRARLANRRSLPSVRRRRRPDSVHAGWRVSRQHVQSNPHTLLLPPSSSSS